MYPFQRATLTCFVNLNPPFIRPPSKNNSQMVLHVLEITRHHHTRTRLKQRFKTIFSSTIHQLVFYFWAGGWWHQLVDLTLALFPPSHVVAAARPPPRRPRQGYILPRYLTAKRIDSTVPFIVYQSVYELSSVGTHVVAQHWTRTTWCTKYYSCSQPVPIGEAVSQSVLILRVKRLLRSIFTSAVSRPTGRSFCNR